MDLKLVHVGLVLFVNIVLTPRAVNLKSVGGDCRLCKPGYYASRLCSDVYDTVCKPCERSTYTSVYNVLNTCTPCTTCVQGQFVLQACTVRSDTVCQSCGAGKRNANSDFNRRCLQGDAPSEPRPSESEVARVTDVSDSKHDMHGKAETESDSSTDHIYTEGSGAESPVETVDANYPVSNETEEIEGSGAIPDVADVTNTSVILPDDGNEDVITTTDAPITTTARLGVIDIGDGIVVENITSERVNELGKPVTIDTIINSVNVDDTAGVVVEDDHYETKDNDAGTVDVNINTKPKTGASHTQRQDDSSGVGTGVVVTVGLVAALVFFIVGFVASRYWSRRQERTFNVLEAERRNGTKSPVECSGVEYKDPENNIPSKTNIYGSVPTNKQANGNTPEVKPHLPQTDAPITKSSAPTTRSQPDDGTDRDWAGFALSRNDSSGSLILHPTKPRAESEIRYIDEDPSEERETDALLPQTSNTTNQTRTEENGRKPKPDDANNETQENESTPMISKDDTANS